MSNWDKKFFGLVEYIAQWSKDTSTKVGAVIVDNSNRVLSLGYNGIPSGCNDNDKSRYERPKKYLYFEHAERNAIFSAAKNGIRLDNSIIYLTKGLPCADCARAIIQSGIKKIITTNESFGSPNPMWEESFKASKEMLEEAGIEIHII